MNTDAWSPAAVQDALVHLGLSPLESPDSRVLQCRNRPFPIRLYLEPDTLRLEVRLKESVQRTKLTLWNIIHHNHRCFPFGQFYLSQDGACCFGARLELAEVAALDPQAVLFSMLNAAEGMGRFVLSDFRELPLEASEVQPNLIAPLREPLPTPPGLSVPDSASIAPLLERILQHLAQDRLLYRLEAGDYALAGDCIIQLQVAEVNPMRRTKGLPAWTVELRTTVGQLERTDDRLWVMTNQWNASLANLGHAVTYLEYAPHLQLATEIPPFLLNQPTWLDQLLGKHELRAEALQRALANRYHLQEPALQALGL